MQMVENENMPEGKGLQTLDCSASVNCRGWGWGGGGGGGEGILSKCRKFAESRAKWNKQK